MPRFSLFILAGAAFATAAAAQVQRAPELPDTVVTATRVPTSLERIGSAISVITAEDLRNRQTTPVSDILREIPGLAVNRNGQLGANTNVRIRGAESQHTKVLIDGVEVNNPDGANREYDFANLLAGDIERIEVLRGAQSVLYGSDAIGGVINIITRRGRGAATAYAQVEGGSFKTHREQAGLSGGSQWVDYAFGFSRLETGGVSSAAERNGNAEQDPYRNLGLGTKLAARPLKESDLELGLVWRRTDARLGFDDFTTQPVDANKLQFSHEQFGRLDGRFSLFDGRLENDIGGSYFTKGLKTNTDGVLDGRFSGSERKFDYQGNFTFDKDNIATFGAVTRTEWVNDTSTIHDSASTSSVFGLYQLGLFDALYLSAGGRYDDHSEFGGHETYRITAAYALRDWGTKPHASYGTGFKAPSLTQLFANFPGLFVGNPNLKPETSRSLDFGVEQKLLQGRLTLDATLFRNDIDNLIQLSGITLVNVTKTEAKGAELSLKAKPTTWLDLSASYTYTLAEDTQTHTELVRRARHLGSFNATAHPREDVTLNAGVVSNGRQADSDFATFPATQRTLGGYTLVNLAASWQVAPWVSLFARVENLFDKQYEEVIGFGHLGRAGYVGVRAVY